MEVLLAEEVPEKPLAAFSRDAWVTPVILAIC